MLYLLSIQNQNKFVFYCRFWYNLRNFAVRKVELSESLLVNGSVEASRYALCQKI